MIKPHIQYNQSYKDKLSTYFYHINLMAERVRDGKKAWKETQFKFLTQCVLVNADQTTKKAN